MCELVDVYNKKLELLALLGYRFEVLLGARSTSISCNARSSGLFKAPSVTKFVKGHSVVETG